jgi:hypothetical protein
VGSYFDNQLLCQNLETVLDLAIPKVDIHHPVHETLDVKQQLKSIIWDYQNA